AVHRAIGTAAAIGVPVAALGMLGYIISGWQVAGLPDYTLGFVYLPALLALVAASVFTAPYGARLAQRLPVATLKRVFALLLYVLATKMIVAYW
ncbi:MAG: TSUP family transporter, partial [Burkholderiales bacterium]|nr:TSUP family transporter [Burkholderiales bacterium]